MDIGAIEIRSLDRETVRQLSQRSDAPGFLQLAVHLALLGATGAGVFVSRGTVWLAPALVLHGIALSFLFCALHETIHRTAFASRWPNEIVAWVCGTVLVLPPEYFRCFHYTHHRFTQDPARDPELAQPGPSTLKSYLWRVSGLPYWQDRLTVTLRHALTGRVTEAFIPAGKTPPLVRDARVLWGGYPVLLALPLFLRRADAPVFSVVPALPGEPVLRLFLLAEHLACAL